MIKISKCRIWKKYIPDGGLMFPVNHDDLANQLLYKQ